ncbi:MAG: GTP cyclohydrolase I [Myxococcota bacterium]
MSDTATELFRRYLEEVGLDETVDPELRSTPERFTELLREMFEGVDADPPVLSTFPIDSLGTDAEPEPIILSGLQFYSMCVHHLVPMFGFIDVAYVPQDRMVGFGSIGRVTDHFAKRPQVQERLVAQIADYLERQLEPEGLLVRCRARQMCMELRGAEKRGNLVTIASRGSLSSGPLRAEVFEQFDKPENGR